MLDAGRKHDIKELKEDYKKTTDPVKKRLIEKAGKKIQAEQYDGWIRDARQTMIHERIQGRSMNVKDVQHEMISKRISKSVSYGFSDVKYWPFKTK